MATWDNILQWLVDRTDRKGIRITVDANVDIKIHVEPAAEPFQVDISEVPTTAQAGVAYSGQIVASGGAGAPFGYAVTGGALPDGLTLDSSSGLISGTPSEADADEDFDATVTVTDASGTVVKAKVAGKKTAK